MANRQVAFSWQVLADHMEPDEVNAVPLFAAGEAFGSSGGRVRLIRWLWWGILGLTLVVTAAGYRLYRTAQAGVEALETELQEAIALDNYTMVNPELTVQSTAPALQSFGLHNGVAAVEVVVHDPTRSLPYRQTRFLRQTASGWQPTTADATFWGSRQELESDHFIFRFSRHDYATVVEAASALDTFYARLHQDLGRMQPEMREKVIVEVMPSYDLVRQGLPVARADPIQVLSPNRLQIPVSLSDTEALVLSVRLALVYRLLPVTEADWLATGNQSVGWWWPPLTEGLRLWLLWDDDPLLTQWRPDILTWYFAGSCQTCSPQTQMVPESYQEFCQAFAMVRLHPRELSIPFSCARFFGDIDVVPNLHFSSPIPPAPLSSLAALSVPDGIPARMETELLQRSYSRQVVSMAMLLEYTAHTYGRELIPELLAAFGAHERWENLVPAVFDVSAETFEFRWRGYLQDQYEMAESD